MKSSANELEILWNMELYCAENLEHGFFNFACFDKLSQVYSWYKPGKDSPNVVFVCVEWNLSSNFIMQVPRTAIQKFQFMKNSNLPLFT